jgi:hypothetical protein
MNVPGTPVATVSGKGRAAKPRVLVELRVQAGLVRQQLMRSQLVQRAGGKQHDAGKHQQHQRQHGTPAAQYGVPPAP